MAVLQLELSVVSMCNVLRMLLTRRSLGLAGMTLLAAAAVAGCGDDSFIATNEIIDPDAGIAGGAGASGTGGQSGGSGSAGMPSGGSAGRGGACTPGDTLELGSCERCGVSRRLCDASGQFGPPVCEQQGECEAGAEESAGCGNCGSNKRTCQNNCTWGAFGSCSGEGVCNPGATQAGGCDSCSHKECTDKCQWSACKLKPGNACNYNAGTNYQCCGAGKWQFCSSSCQWHPCATCTGCC
jgi:hypothetical protein